MDGPIGYNDKWNKPEKNKYWMTLSVCGIKKQIEPDILECEVKWSLGNITMNKAGGGDGIPAKLFETLQLMLRKCCSQYSSKFGKLSSGHRTWKGQFSLQSLKKAMPKNPQTTAQLHSFTC